MEARFFLRSGHLVWFEQEEGRKVTAKGFAARKRTALISSGAQAEPDVRAVLNLGVNEGPRLFLAAKPFTNAPAKRFE